MLPDDAADFPMNDISLIPLAKFARCKPLLLSLLAGMLCGCPTAPDAQPHQPVGGSALVILQAIDLIDFVRFALDPSPVQLGAVRNEWTSFILEIRGFAFAKELSLR